MEQFGEIIFSGFVLGYTLQLFLVMFGPYGMQTMACKASMLPTLLSPDAEIYIFTSLPFKTLIEPHSIDTMSRHL